MPGEPTELYVRTRRALLDALDALGAHRTAVVLVGAQAIYLHTGEVDEAIATETKDSDLVIDPQNLGSDPLLEEALAKAGFHLDLERPEPGTWLSADGIPVDLLVPAGVAPGGPSRRSVKIPPHDRMSLKRVPGLEAALVDQDAMIIEALGEGDSRQHEIAVAGPSALLVSKLQKITDRQQEVERRRVAKDGHDVYRLLRDVATEELDRRFRVLAAHDLSRDAVPEAMAQLEQLFATAASPGAAMAGRTVAGVGEPAAVQEAASVLAEELLGAVRRWLTTGV
jgi:hypothetical protein